MSHLGDTKDGKRVAHGRALGDEWADWDGKGGSTSRAGKAPFLITAAVFALLTDAILCVGVYMITPRIAGWSSWLPTIAWLVTAAYIVISTCWFVQLVITAITERNAFLRIGGIFSVFNFALESIFRLAGLVGLSQDHVGHSFVRVSNAVTKATKVERDPSDEVLLILLPRCLTKEQLREINSLKEIYPLHIHTVSGGELARKKVREIAPTAIIGVACERDLVSGIRDVGSNFSVIGIPNDRPEGPCKNTVIDMNELITTIEFYVGPPRPRVEDVSEES
jgi:uncharacterized protein